MRDERTRAPTDAELLQWLAKTCEERYPYRNGETYHENWRPTDDTVRPVGYGVLRQLNAHIASLTRELEEARRGFARWKGIVRDARAKSGKWGEQARWELPDPDWRPRTEEELARLREQEKPRPAPLENDISRAVSGSELGGDHLEQGVAQPAAKAEE